jgi:hypothetical protein
VTQKKVGCEKNLHKVAIFGGEENLNLPNLDNIL